MRSTSRSFAPGLLIIASLLMAAWSIVPSGCRATDGDAVAESRSTSSRAVEPVKTGTLIVRVEDAAVHEPLPGIALRVVVDPGVERLFATATTDADGAARFEGVDAGMVIVEALRTPPHARAFGYVWLEAGETEAVLVEMVAGKTVRGRVVDDVGTPLAGAVVAVNDEYGAAFQTGNVAASSDLAAVTTPADGTFELECLAPYSRELRRERGVMVSGGRGSQGFQVRFEDAHVYQTTSIQPTAEGIQDLGRVVVPRARTWAGRVVDAHGAPIAGAFVSARKDRFWSRDPGRVRHDPANSTWPGIAGFRLREQECVCDDAGRFELRCRPTGSKFSAWTPRGQFQSFAIPEAGPGGRVDDVELRLDDVSLIVLELVDGAGRPVTGPHEQSRLVFRPASPHLPADQIAVTVRGDGVDDRTAIYCDPDERFRVQLGGAVRGAATLGLDVPGYLRVVRDVDLDAPGSVRLVLEPEPALHLRVRFEGNRRVDPVGPLRVQLHACIGDPARRRAARWSLYGDDGCCGLGSARTIEVGPETTEIVLPVEADRPFFVTVRDDDFGPWSQTFGPWRPGATVHDVVVPKFAPRAGRELAPALLRARVTDARSGKPIQAYLRFADPGEEPHVVQTFGVRQVIVYPGDDEARDAPAGRWRTSIESAGYRSPPPFEVDLAAGVERDLGAFALEPYPVVEIDVVGAVGEWTRIEFGDAEGRSIGRGEIVDGHSRVQADLPPRGIASVIELGDAFGDRSQSFSYEYDGRLELRLAPWRAVDVRCPVADPIELSAALRVTVDDTRFGDRWPVQGRHLYERAPEADARRLTGWLAPGTYVLRAKSLVLGDSEMRLEVPAAGADVVRVELRPVR